MVWRYRRVTMGKIGNGVIKSKSLKGFGVPDGI